MQRSKWFHALAWPALGLGAVVLFARRLRGSRVFGEAVTINRPPDEVARVWQELCGRPGFPAAGGEVELAPAPGQRGTELHVHQTGGPIRHHQLKNELRRLKQVLETGEELQ